MGATNNWVKDGLDSYLAITGEHRAEKKAESDLENQKQMLRLAQNADQRAAVTTGLSNQMTQININKGLDDQLQNKKLDDLDIDGLLFEHAYKAEVNNPHTPTAATIKDPAQVDASKYVYGNSLKAVAYIRQMPGQSMSIPYDQMTALDIPGYVQSTAQNMFEPSAMKRAGQESYDPATGTVGVLTGRMGHINIEKTPEGEAFISADMEVRNPDGSIRFAPFTDGTDNHDRPIKRVPLSAIEYEATATLQGIDDALQTGNDPSVAIAARKVRPINSLPREYKKKILEQRLEEEKNLRTRESDVANTIKVSKKLEAMQADIDALDWKADPHGATAKLYAKLAQSGMTTGEVDQALKIVTSAKVPPEKNLQIEEVGAGGNSVQKVIVSKDGKTQPLGKPYQKHATPAGGNGDDLKLREKLGSVDKDIHEASVNLRAAQKETTSGNVSAADMPAHLEYVKELKTKLARHEARKAKLLGEATGAEARDGGSKPPARPPLSSFSGASGDSSSETPYSRQFGLTQ